ncbi:hypothetical protein [Methylobacterium iners]|uniref:Uncharacterized protein n=1 Tax=Methylobacterium iners TaxID=418707 RepID=A0ABQ4S129_9HYPH|nr:hypothetical protein [Methylobacterium iners]GJD95882.1 hypothetical protein OCOJLMKI_3098 [Methylobacterium iners]
MSEVATAVKNTPAYRALVLAPDGAVVEIHSLIAADDDEALALARCMVDGHAIEIWDGLRFIEHIDPAQTQP